MKKILTAVLLFGIIAIANAKEKVVFGLENKENFPHYIGVGSQLNKEKPGLTIEILQLVARDLDFDIEFKRMPWKRCLSEMKFGKIDGTFNASFKTKRMEMGEYPMKNGKVNPEKRITTSSYVLYKQKGNPFNWTGSEFENMTGKIGAPFGYSVVDDLKKLGIIADTSPSLENDLKKLNIGRLQAIAEFELTADILIQKNPKYKNNIEKVKTPLKVKPYYVMLSHQFVQQHPELSKKIWDKIEQYRISHAQKLAVKYSD